MRHGFFHLSQNLYCTKTRYLSFSASVVHIFDITFSESKKKYAREIGSIVLGVLIALGATEAAEATRWWFRVKSATEAIDDEIIMNLWVYTERKVRVDCYDRKLAAIGAILKQAQATGELSDIGDLGDTGMRSLHQSAYDVAVSEGIPLRISKIKAQDWARIHKMRLAYAAESEQENRHWANLKILEHNPGIISEDMLASITESWANARYNHKFASIIADQSI